jgi:hypothetical protein
MLLSCKYTNIGAIKIEFVITTKDIPITSHYHSVFFLFRLLCDVQHLGV